MASSKRPDNPGNQGNTEPENSSPDLIRAIRDAQSQTFGQGDINVLFENLLENFLSITQSEYGFIGQVLTNERKQKFLKTLALTNIAWNERTRKFYDEQSSSGMEFYNLNTLFGQVIVTGKPVLSNDPKNDPRRGGLPEGHPPLNSFMGLPLYSGETMIGMVGMANKPEGYDEQIVSTLQPFLATCSNIIIAHINDQKRKEAEEALRVSEERLKLALEGATDGLWDWNVATGEVYFSPRWMTMLGYEPFELERNMNTWEKLVHPNDIPEVMRVLTDHLEGKTDFYQTEHRVKAKNGDWIWILDRGKVVERDREGNPLRAVGTHADITQLKLTEEKLKNAVAEAERANRAKSEFLSRMSHELRTPLNAILGFGQLLKLDKNLNRDQMENSEKIIQAGNHLLLLIDEVLDLSRIEAGETNLSIEPVSVNAVVEESIFLLTFFATELKVVLHKKTDCPELMAKADRTRFKQILLNLISNAIKYNKVGGEVFIEWQIQNEHRLLLKVSDTGSGIPPEKQEKIFDMFYRSREHYDKIQGAGIGLNLSKKFAELMEGSIDVQSTEGKGSCFTLELPLVRKNISNKREATFQTEAQPLKLQKPATILYIEDNPENIEVVEKFLKKWPETNLSCALKPQAGIDLARKLNPDLILIDIQLPEMDGFAVFNKLRSFEETARIPVIALSANAMPQNIEKAYSIGFQGYLTKPLDIAEFSSALKKILE